MRKVFSLLLVSVMLFSIAVGPVVKPVKAAEDWETLRIVQKSSAAALFMGTFNPSYGGYGDVYTVRLRALFNDPALAWGNDGVPHNYRCKVLKVERNVKVPNDAVVFNSTTDKWEAKFAGKEAKVKVVYQCGLGEWHSGNKITLADIAFAIAMDYEWATKDGENDPYYYKRWDSRASDTLATIKGFVFKEETDDYVIIEVYQDYDFPLDDMITASNYVPYGAPRENLPWQLYYAMSELVAHSKDYGDRDYVWGDAKEGQYEIDQIQPDHAMDIKKALEKLKEEKPIPDFLKPFIKDEKEAISGYDKIISFIDKHKHAVISNGPYYIDKYDKGAKYVRLLKFEGKRVGYPDPELPWDANFKVVEYKGIDNEETIILSVAKGEYDMAVFSFAGYRFKNLDEEYKKNLALVRSVGGFWSLALNPAHDDNSKYLITVGNKTYFNPFAINEIGFALNYLISRNYVIQNILQGSAGPLYTGVLSGSKIPYEKVSVVPKAFGFNARSDEEKALKMIEEAMQKAAEEVAKEGHKLEKKDGKWYFDGEPVKIVGITRTDDEERKKFGFYVGELLKKAGFEVDVQVLDRVPAIKAVYYSDPYEYKWGFYTEGWGSSGSEKYPLWDIVWWFSEKFVGFTPAETTVKDLVDKGIIDKLQLEYYNKDTLKDLYNWTCEELGTFLQQLTYVYNNKTYELTNEKQFWDLLKIGYAMGLLDGHRVFIVENWEFYPINKKVKFSYKDPAVGLGSDMMIRAAYKEKPTPTTSTVTTSTTTTTTKSPTRTQSTSSPTQSSTTSTTGGICGPVLMVGLTLVPLLLRKRK